MRIAILGAGQTGRGFLARLFHRQAELVLIDRDPGLVDRLNRAGGYTIRFFGARPDERIAGYTALTLQDAQAGKALSGCDAVFVSVRGENAAQAGHWLAGLLPRGVPVVVCENAASPAKLLGEPLAQVAASAAVFCTTLADGPLDIKSEDFPALYADRGRLSPALLSLEGMEPVDNFQALMERKLYTYNAASGLIAYLGLALGYQDYAMAANDPLITRVLDLFYRQINRAICLRYGVTAKEQEDFAALSKRKFQNPDISDTVARNAASPLRKLAPDERLIAPARMIAQNGEHPFYFAAAIASALAHAGCYSADAAKGMLSSVCKLDPGDSLWQATLDSFLDAARMDSLRNALDNS